MSHASIGGITGRDEEKPPIYAERTQITLKGGRTADSAELALSLSKRTPMGEPKL